MAAVAGSKGRISVAGNPTHSHQAALAGRLIDGSITTHQLVRDLLALARIREVGVDTNMICNLACSYCYLDDRPKQKGMRSPAEWEADLVPLVEAGCKLIAFIGKEPLADTVALDTIERLRTRFGDDRTFRIGMVTNGTLVGRRLSRLQQADLDYLDISLDSIGDANDAQRGRGVSDRVMRNIDKYLETTPVNDFSIASVLHRSSAPNYSEFVTTLFAHGVQTAFGSPILRFTESDAVATFALTTRDLLELLQRLIEALAQMPHSAKNGKQVIIDLPYKYSWAFVRNNLVDWREIQQDTYEAHYFRPDARVPLYIKFNFFPMSFWRAIRITHDGSVIENMDIAAHPNYGAHARQSSDQEGRWYFGNSPGYARTFLEAFVDQHSCHSATKLYDREVAKQFEHLRFADAA